MTIRLDRVWMLLAVFAAAVLVALPGGLRADGDVPPEDEDSQRTGVIRGVVVDGHGHGVEGATVELFTIRGHHRVRVARTRSGPHGHFEFPHVHAGGYMVEACEPHVGCGSAHVQVHAGHVSNVRVVLRRH